jgi:hypothetical protein
MGFEKLWGMTNQRTTRERGEGGRDKGQKVKQRMCGYRSDNVSELLTRKS